ncbi:MAG: MoxR family ATPase [Lentisphaerae bacterium]|nr:MAG: MoxR family ATPase [Lentisphaerota bacterium]
MQGTLAADTMSDEEKVALIGDAYRKMLKEIRKTIIGQEQVVEDLLTCIFAGGHALLVGVPGLAKTLLVTTLSQVLKLKFKRIQFTPDLMPSDITGTDVIQDDPVTHERVFKFMPGPIFANVILADEINRTPPKTQAALLEAMQEKQVSIGRKIYKLAAPFFVIATQNPIDQEGTYPLPEAQQDRFLFNIFVDYPEFSDEMEIVNTVTSGVMEEVQPVVTGEDILVYRDLIRRAPVAEHVLKYAVMLVRATRREKEEAPDFIREWVSFGAGPRAGLALIGSAKARAILHGNYHVSVEDVMAVAKPVLRHRIAPTFAAQAEGITPDVIVDRLLEHIPRYDG